MNISKELSKSEILCFYFLFVVGGGGGGYFKICAFSEAQGPDSGNKPMGLLAGRACFRGNRVNVMILQRDLPKVLANDHHKTDYRCL